MISKLKKTILISLCSISISLITVNYFMFKENGLYEIYFKDKVIGYYPEIPEVKEVCSNVVSNINDRLSSDEVSPNDFKFKRVNNAAVVSARDEIKENIVKSIDNEILLTSIEIKDKSYGVIAKEEEGKKILQKIGQIYINNSEMKDKDVVSVDVKTNIRYKKITGKLSNLMPIDQIAQKILEENKDGMLVNIDVKCREKKVEEILPSVKVIKDDHMYLGQTEKEEGGKGAKEIIVDTLYRNGNKIEEKKLEEKVIKESKEEVVYTGTKNPIEDGIAFLSNPTQGGSITSYFGPRWGSTHSGMDIAKNMGDPVYAAFDGEVKESQYQGNYGNKILLLHEGNIETIYGHLSKYEVKAGDKVSRGQLIGRVGSTGRSTGPHLHFEVRVNGSPVDPRKYLIN